MNFSYRPPEKQVNPMDFVPGEKDKEKNLANMKPEEQAQHLISMFSKKSYNR